MPEMVRLWLLEIISDIKYENISHILRPSMNNLDLEKLEMKAQKQK